MRASRLATLTLPLCLIPGLLLPAAAFARSTTGLRIDTRVPVSFRIQVAGRPQPGTTFWVAYGPTAGAFGIVQLKPQGSSMWGASKRLPADARVDLAYLAGRGVIHTRFGPAPRDPVTVIRHLPPTPVSRLRLLHTVRWTPPTG